jgi:hypothetical protein
MPGVGAGVAALGIAGSYALQTTSHKTRSSPHLLLMVAALSTAMLVDDRAVAITTGYHS